MAAPDVRIVKQQGLGRRTPSDDNISGLVMGGVATVATVSTAALAIGQIIKLSSALDANGYGLDDAYDTANNVLVYHHIARFFRRSPNATLYVMLVPQGEPLSDMVDKTEPYLKSLLVYANGAIRQAGVVLNPLTSYTPTISSGIDADVTDAVPVAQELADEEFSLHRPVDIIIEGRSFNGTASAAPDLRSLASPQVAVVIGADPAISTSAAINNGYAAVGDALGTISAAKVNESIGWVGKFNLTNTTDAVFVTAGLSSNLDTGTYVPADIDQLHNKGYLFTRYHAQKSGVYWNGYPTCTLISDDAAYGENSRTLNKAARLVRGGLIDELNAPVALNDDGTIKASVIGSLEAQAEDALTQMLKDGEISAKDVYIDPSQVFISNGEELDVQFKIVPVGVARNIVGYISLVPKI